MWDTLMSLETFFKYLRYILDLLYHVQTTKLLSFLVLFPPTQKENIPACIVCKNIAITCRGNYGAIDVITCVWNFVYFYWHYLLKNCIFYYFFALLDGSIDCFFYYAHLFGQKKFRLKFSSDISFLAHV